MPDEVKGSFGRVFVISDHARRQWAARFPDALSTIEHAVRFGRAVKENEFGIALYYALERAMFVCNRADGGRWAVATVLADLGRRPVVSLGPRPSKRQREEARVAREARNPNWSTQ